MRRMSKKRRETIYKRDKYRCRNPICISRHSKYNKHFLEIHHIHPYSEFPEMDAFDINLISLCSYCHSCITKGKGEMLDHWLRCVEYASNQYFEAENKMPSQKLIRSALKFSSEWRDREHLEEIGIMESE